MVMLITYADRFAGSLEGLNALLESRFPELFSGVHILPFYTPIDGADAGFDPINHLVVDPRIGSWVDIQRIGESYSVMADMIVNHISAESELFHDVLHRGQESPSWDLFLRKTDVFEGDDDAVADGVEKIYRPRPGAPFTAQTLDTGEVHEFWTTFSSKQLDIDVESASGQHYLESILSQLSAAGVREVRLDAAGYAIKRRNTSCFMLPETFDFIAQLSNSAGRRGIETLVEVHAHFEVQREIAERVDRVYDFALPPLVLHALYTNDCAPLKHWLDIAPRNCVTVLDTHDGIGIVDVGPDSERPGLLNETQIDSLVETIHAKTGGSSRLASGQAASNLDIYQVNSTYYDALGGIDIDYLIARAIQLFVPGKPQVYYVGLMAGGNDMELVERTGVGRDINRHYFTAGEVDEALRRPVVAELLQLIRLRNSLDVFSGEFSLEDTGGSELALCWQRGQDHCRLFVSLKDRRALIAGEEAGETYKHEVGMLLEKALVAI